MDEKLAPTEYEENQDDKGSNNDGSTASQSSEEFVKVNKDEAALTEGGGDIPRDVEELTPISSEVETTGTSLLDRIDPRAIPTENMASDSYLKDYYDQLPSETAEFTAGETGNLLGASPIIESGDDTGILQPEVLPPQDPFDSAPPMATDSNLAAELSQGGHPSFEPAPASSFEPQAVHTIPEEPELVPVETGVVCSKPVNEEEIASEFDQNNQYEFDPMASGQDHQDNVQDDAEAFTPEPELLPVVEPEPTPEVEPEIVKEEASDEEEVPTPPEYKQEAKEIPAPPVVEDIDTEPEKTPVSSQIPAADDVQKEAKPAGDDEDPVIDLIYWRCLKKSAAVFTFLLVMLTSLICFSVISVISYAGLSLLTVTVAFRLYRLVLQTLNGTQQPHPFQEFLDVDINISEERIHKYANAILGHLNCMITAARDLFLVKNTISSLKFGVFLWLLTYVGALFNGLTLLIIDTVLIFTVPPIYEKYQTPIDNYYGLARDKITDLMTKVKAKLPGAKKEKAQ